MTPIATSKANFSIENQTEICPKVTANAIKPAKIVKIQNMVYFLSWQLRHVGEDSLVE